MLTLLLENFCFGSALPERRGVRGEKLEQSREKYYRSIKWDPQRNMQKWGFQSKKR